MKERPLMVGLGELLWDLLPSGRVLGGAPANFVYMTSLLGNRGVVASRVGTDELGQEARLAMRRIGLDTSYLQIDDKHQTGTAAIVLDAEGQAQFTITDQVAWDFLEWTPAWRQLSEEADVVCFGTLAQRSQDSAICIEQFLRSVSKNALRICDANLRDPYFNSEILRASFDRADIVKVNKIELNTIAALLRVDGKDESQIALALIEQFNLALVCVTRGGEGSLIASRERVVTHPGFDVKVADTVGAGDAFTACLAHFYLHGESLEEISERANRFGAWVASQTGATPEIDNSQLAEILEVAK